VPSGGAGGLYLDSVIRQQATPQQLQMQRPQQLQKPKVQAAAPARKTSNADGAEKQQAAKPSQTLSSSLQMLSGEDPDCLFIVRRINKLGFKASRILKQHFSSYGSVVRVLVAHSTVRQQGDESGQGVRRRPSSLGFVQMQSAEAVRRVLAAGGEQQVKGASIRVQKFEQKLVGEDEHEEAQDDICGDFPWSRVTSAASQDEPLPRTGAWQRFTTGDSLNSVSTFASSASEHSEQSS